MKQFGETDKVINAEINFGYITGELKNPTGLYRAMLEGYFKLDNAHLDTNSPRITPARYFSVQDNYSYYKTYNLNSAAGGDTIDVTYDDVIMNIFDFPQLRNSNLISWSSADAKEDNLQLSYYSNKIPTNPLTYNLLIKYQLKNKIYQKAVMGNSFNLMAQYDSLWKRLPSFQYIETDDVGRTSAGFSDRYELFQLLDSGQNEYSNIPLFTITRA